MCDPDGAEKTDGAEGNAGDESMTNETARAIQTVRAKDLLGERGVVLIEHDGEVYTLRKTRNGRLILTK